MKTLAILIALSCMSLLTGSTFLACDDPSTNDTAARELELARAVASLELGADSGFQEFEGATLVSVQPYYDMDGNLMCHMFGVGRNGEIVGTIVVGNSAYDNMVFEAFNAPPPLAPSAAEAQESLARDLGITVDQESVAEPQCLLYLGPANVCAVYEVDGHSFAIHLWTKRAEPASELKLTMPSPEQMREYEEARQL
jgi:hypothetical protein